MRKSALTFAVAMTLVAPAAIVQGAELAAPATPNVQYYSGHYGDHRPYADYQAYGYYFRPYDYYGYGRPFTYYNFYQTYGCWASNESCVYYW